ncbi:MAG TPA: hypothetical protein VF765_16465 [Polyangiaceae bacterium]
MRCAAFLVACIVAGGTLGPAWLAGDAHAAPQPEETMLLPRSAVVLRAAADADGVVACVAGEDGGARALVRVGAGGRATTLAGAVRVEEMALDRERVYWVGADGILAIARAGGPVVPLAARDWSLLAADSDASRWAIALDGGDVYFSIDDAVGLVSKEGGEARRLDGAPGAMLIGVDAQDVWWLESVLEDDDSTTQTLWATPKRGGASRSVLAGLAQVLTAVVGDGAVFLLRETGRPGRGVIERVDARTREITALATDVALYAPRVLAVQNGWLYWLDYPDGLHGPTGLRAVPDRGGDATALGSFFPPASRLVAGSDAVYAFGEGLHAFSLRGTSGASAGLRKVEVNR